MQDTLDKSKADVVRTKRALFASQEKVRDLQAQRDADSRKLTQRAERQLAEHTKAETDTNMKRLQQELAQVRLVILWLPHLCFEYTVSQVMVRAHAFVGQLAVVIEALWVVGKLGEKLHE